jgi:pyridoxal/pyridoxine/pyridoxamine kinase
MAALDYLHNLGPSIVIITSTFFTNDIQLFASLRDAKDSEIIRIDIPKLDKHFTGTGDILCAMLLTQLDKYPGEFAKAVEIAVNALRGCLLRSIEQPIPGTNEVSVIASKDILESP